MILKSRRVLIWLVVATAFALMACHGPTPTPAPAITPVEPAPRAELARHYAPIIYQGAASDQDFITAVNFDGDWIGNNNWEHQPDGVLRAFVYDAVIETETHWYLSIPSPTRRL